MMINAMLLLDGCLEEERIALLQIQTSFNYPTGKSFQRYSWGGNASCCHWEGVFCNGTTERVVKIDLFSKRLAELGDWCLNATLFLPFRELNILDLGRNSIRGCVENEGFERLSKLSNLEILDLSDNKFNNSILTSLSALSSLKVLDLSINLLEGSLNIEKVNLLRTLEVLRLEVNEIEGFTSFYGGDELLKLKNLEHLDLFGNRFNNNIVSSLKDLSSLKSLNLSYNQLEGSINMKELDALINLETVNLDGNEIDKLVFLKDSRGFRNLSYISLYNMTTNGSIPSSLLQSLAKFPNLRILFLGKNHFDGTILAEALPSLKNLEELDLSSSTLSNSIIMKTIGRITTLKSLYLYGCGLNGTIPTAQGLCDLKHLQTLDLRYNQLNGALPWCLSNLTSLQSLEASGNYFIGLNSTIPTAQVLCELKHLQTLDLSDNDLNGALPWCLSNLTSLQSLDVSHNHFTRLNSTIPTAQVLCKLKHLQTLYLYDNDLNGALPWCLSNLTSLKSLDVSYNHFTGNISSSPLISLTSLQELALSDNHFQIAISLSPFFNHSKLKYFDGANNEIYVEELEEHNLAPKFQLEVLYLSGYGHDGAFPKFLFNQSNLQLIDFSNMKLRVGFPNWLLDNNTNLYRLRLANNSLSGPFQLPIHPHVNLSELDISDNYFDSHIPIEIGAYFPSLTSLFMSGNEFIGSIPSSFGLMLHLQVLDLSQNNISGTLPSCFDSLQLVHVYLSHNTLQGHLEDAFRNSSELTTLDLSHNRLSGSIPEWIGEIAELAFLLLGYNNLEGRMPFQLCNLNKLSFIDLSHNNFSGNILPCLRFRSSFWLTQQDNGSVEFLLREPLEITTKSISYTYAPSVLYYISGMDLSCNNFGGGIPREIGNLNHIQLLNLSNNHLIGPIPQTFSNLSQVESLDLSNNNLNGKIPPQLVELHFLAFFSVAHNNLSGKTLEMIAQFSTFNKSSYEENPLLCGPPLPRNCTDEEAPSSPPKISTVNKEESDFIDKSVFCVSFVVTYIMVLLSIAAVLHINPNWRRAWFYFIEENINKCYYFLIDHLLKPFGIRGWKIWCE